MTRHSSIFNQRNSDMDSGLACLWMVVQYYDKNYSAERFRNKTGLYKKKSTLADISQAAEKLGFRARCIRIGFNQLIRDVPMPCIVRMGDQQFAILPPQSRSRASRKIKCLEPATGLQQYSKDNFIEQWTGAKLNGEIPAGEVLVAEPTFEFRNRIEKNTAKLNWRILLQFFQRSRWQVAQLITALLITSLFQLIIPFLMQSIVDVGIHIRDMDYITAVLIAQLMLMMSRLSVDIIRTRLLLHISSTVNLSILSDFWIKLTRLPLSYFDRQHTGDILQRINDNKQVQNFLTGPTLNTIFSTLNFVVFAIVLMMYKVQLFFIFVTGMVLYFGWMIVFLRFRRKVNYQLFNTTARENNSTLQLVQGMQDIRLNNIGQLKRWEWEGKQVEIFRLNRMRLTYSQMQQAGALLINQGKDLVLTFTVAKLLIEGQLTFGAMLAVQYIIGQLSSPVEQLIGFVQQAQDAKISMERINEIHVMEDEEKENLVMQLPRNRIIVISDLSFAYPGNASQPVLKNLQLEIPEGKTTAIVGESGSGKTTLIKLLLKFYENYDGHIHVGDMDFKQVSHSYWRSQCGSVLQDSFIFNDSIANNISLQYEPADTARLTEACRMANILSFIETLPQGFDTPLGANGMGISQGQKQRLLIARAIYKNPKFLFLDESTSSLDETNEKAIVENLRIFSENRTVITIAHRLSTVKNADNIIVLHQGSIIEQGTHYELTRVRGKYFKLIKSQLHLGSD